MSLDGSGFTSARAKIGLFATQKRNKIVVGLPGEIREYTARALIDGRRLTEDSTLTSKFVLKAIIIGDANGAPIPFARNPHSFLIDPCNLETTPDVPMSLALLKMFPTFVTGDETCFTQTAASTIKKHDILKVSLTVGPDGTLNLDHGKILSLVQKAPLEDPSSKECLSIQGAFDTQNFVLLGGSDPGPATSTLDDGGCPWSGARYQKTAIWNSTKFPTWNGKEMKNGQLETTGMLVSDPKSGTKLVPPAMADFLKLAAAFEAKFGKPLTGSGYRTYDRQVYQRQRRNKTKCGETKYNSSGTDIGVAAIPGTSGHGWGAAVDLDRSKWEGGASIDKAISSAAKEFRWLNKFSKNYNFVFGVGGEHWHLDWMPFSDQVDGYTGKRTPQTAWTTDGQDDDSITFA